MPHTAASQLPPAASTAACAPSILKTLAKRPAAAWDASISTRNDNARRVTLARSPSSRASMFTSRMSGSTRIAGPTAQKPTMAPSVFSMRSSTSNRRYGCT